MFVYFERRKGVKRIGYLLGVVGIVFAVMMYSGVKASYASSCCSKDAAAAENADTKCVVCGKAIEKDKGVKTECQGKTITLAARIVRLYSRKDPCKFCKDEKCEKRKGKASTRGGHSAKITVPK